MAKTRIDYIDLGAASFRSERDHGGVKHDFSRDNQSWQARAYWFGYDGAAKQATTRREPEGETHAETLARVDAQIKVEHAERAQIAELQKRPFVQAAGGFQVPRAVLKHCNQLQAIADTSDDPVRAARCVRKIETILGKWGKRAHAHQLRAGL